MSGLAAAAASVDAWLQPLHGDLEPCGKDPEYDNDFLALTQAVAGKAESQFGPAEPPEWLRAKDTAEKIFDRCRDLRVAISWTRSALAVEGIGALPQGLRLVHGLLTGMWEGLHPLLDDGDAYARVNALALLVRAPDGLLGELRVAKLIDSRTIGELTVRNVEIMLGTLPARAGEAAKSRDQVVQMLAAADAQSPALREQLDATLVQLKALGVFLNDKLGSEQAPDLRPLIVMIGSVVTLMPAVAAPEEAVMQTEVETPATPGAPAKPAAPQSALSGSVLTRADAIRAIDMVCDYLDRAEPTSPAQLLLRRSRRLINQNFLQLLKEFAPASLDEVARVMGIDPASVEVDKKT
ncbi:type VI secretion system protein TssA [soil metagenome]